MTWTSARESYSSECSSLTFDGTVLCHHFQSDEFFANVFPDAVDINVESYLVRTTEVPGKVLTKSNAATFLFFVFLLWSGPVVYLPTTRLLLTTRHDIGAGFF